MDDLVGTIILLASLLVEHVANTISRFWRTVRRIETHAVVGTIILLASLLVFGVLPLLQKRPPSHTTRSVHTDLRRVASEACVWRLSSDGPQWAGEPRASGDEARNRRLPPAAITEDRERREHRNDPAHQMISFTACEVAGPPGSNGRMAFTVAVRG